MFLRTVKARGGKGVQHEYVRLVEGYREHGQLVDGAKPAFSPAAETSGVLLRRLLGAQVGLDFGAPAARPAFEDAA